MNPADKLNAALWEADRHAETFTEALAEWDSAPAADWQSLEADRGRVRPPGRRGEGGHETRPSGPRSGVPAASW